MDVSSGRHQAPVVTEDVVACQCGREPGFRVNTAPGWTWHTGPVVGSEGNRRPLYVITHYGPVDPPSMGKHQVPVERSHVVPYGNGPLSMHADQRIISIEINDAEIL